MIWCGSTEIYLEPSAVHQTLEAFEKGLGRRRSGIAPSMLYAWAALKEGIPFANGAPNLTVDIPALQELSKQDERADLRQGLQDRPDVHQDGAGAGLQGAHAGRERLVLDQHPGQPRRRSAGRSGQLQDQGRVEAGRAGAHLQPELNPDLYKDIYHKVRINYYPPRGDNKEGWDNIDIFGWLGYPMQIKVDFLCRDSILAAPLALDLCLFMDLAARTPACAGSVSRSG
jgi:myo-inositol-1-phosphate synthase